MLLENMMMALSAVKANKMRSFLTMLGIIIGIGSVISIVSIGDSMRAVISDEYKNIGINLAILRVSYYVDDWRETDNFTMEEVDRIREVFADDIDYIVPAAFVSSDSTFGRNKVKIDFEGIDYNYTDVQNVNLLYGRMLNESDILGRKNNVVLEEKAALRLYGTANAVGKTFRTTIYGTTSDYHVVGVYRKEISALMAAMQGNSQSEAAFIPYTILVWPNDYISNIYVYGSESISMDALEKKIVKYTAKLKDREEYEIDFYTAQEEMSSMDSMMGGLSLAVGAIAGISLVVGGIGIMNIMLVSVTERTREIGIRKALGAKTRDVMIQFLTESAFISAFGGIIGVASGVGLVSLGGSLLGVGVVVKPTVVIIAVSFSAIVGIFFGLYPASKAAKSDPIDALRYE